MSIQDLSLGGKVLSGEHLEPPPCLPILVGWPTGSQVPPLSTSGTLDCELKWSHVRRTEFPESARFLGRKSQLLEGNLEWLVTVGLALQNLLPQRNKELEWRCGFQDWWVVWVLLPMILFFLFFYLTQKEEALAMSEVYGSLRLWFFQWSCMDVRVGLWRRLSAEELMLLNCGVGEDSWESLGLQGDPTSPFWRSALGFLWKEWCWSWNSSTLATSCEELTHWERPWCWEGLGAGGEGDDRGWDGWMASPTWWTWVWVNSGSWWWTGRPGVRQFMGSQRVGHDWATKLNWTDTVLCFSFWLIYSV